MYSIEPLQISRFDEALDFVCREFTANSVLHKNSGVSLTEYTDYLRKPFIEMAGRGLSFLAVDQSTSDIAGCLVAGDFSENYSSNAPIPTEIKAINALIKELESDYLAKRTIRAGTTLFVDIAVVTKAARGQGNYFNLRQAVHNVGIANGFERVVGELSSTAAQRMCVEKLGHRVISQINYKSFEYEGRFPFADVDEPEGIQLAEGNLTTTDGR